MTESDALKWLAELFEEPAEAITPSTPRTAIPAWDSLGVLTLIAALDEQFGIALSDADIQHFETARDVLDVLQRNGKLS